MFKPGDRIVLTYPFDKEEASIAVQLRFPSRYLGTFLEYRSQEERDEWRGMDDCWVQLDGKGRMCYPSSWLSPLTEDQYQEVLSLISNTSS